MRFVRAKHLFLTATAILSLFVSAVSACACSHHEPTKKVVESSCHGPSHEAPTDGQANLLRSHFESDCNCYVRTPVPAIVKKDEKRTAVEERIAEIAEVPVSFAIEFESGAEAEVPLEPPDSNYQNALLALLPSRAPPRL